ncbi:MAG TPA: hypothetical protein VFY23_04770 [Candidatus Limnocylindrales bacterium]|nr:hypothetical protein [Candidatus Limnocylindrales bacterium]
MTPDVADPVQAPPHRRRRPPFGLLILVGIMVAKSILLILLILGTFTLGESELIRVLRVEGISAAIEETLVALVGLLVIAVVLLWSALLLLARRRIGWLVAMVTTGIFIAFDIIGFLEGTGNFIWQALNIITVLYLNQREVRESVGALTPEVLDTASAAGVR